MKQTLVQWSNVSAITSSFSKPTTDFAPVPVLAHLFSNSFSSHLPLLFSSSYPAPLLLLLLFVLLSCFSPPHPLLLLILHHLLHHLYLFQSSHILLVPPSVPLYPPPSPLFLILILFLLLLNNKITNYQSLIISAIHHHCNFQHCRLVFQGRQLTVTRRRVLRRIITRNGEDIVIEESISPSLSRQSSFNDVSDDDRRLDTLLKLVSTNGLL